MQTLADLNRQEKAKIKALEADIREVIESTERKRIAIKDFGGFIDRPEITELLEVSEARVGVLLAEGRFRSSYWGYSLRDVKQYAKNRKSGRPRKKKKHNAAQMRLKL